MSLQQQIKIYKNFSNALLATGSFNLPISLHVLSLITTPGNTHWWKHISLTTTSSPSCPPHTLLATIISSKTLEGRSLHALMSVYPQILLIPILTSSSYPTPQLPVKTHVHGCKMYFYYYLSLYGTDLLASVSVSQFTLQDLVINSLLDTCLFGSTGDNRSLLRSRQNLITQLLDASVRAVGDCCLVFWYLWLPHIYCLPYSCNIVTSSGWKFIGAHQSAQLISKSTWSLEAA